MRRVLLLLLACALATGVAFIAAIVVLPTGGVTLHEVAASTLGIFLLLALWPAVLLRSVDRGPMVRIIIALIALVIAALAGASLALGTVSRELAGLPLVPLGVMLVAVADGIRVTRGVRTSPLQEGAEPMSPAQP